MKPLDQFLQVDRMFFIVIYMFLKFQSIDQVYYFSSTLQARFHKKEQ